MNTVKKLSVGRTTTRRCVVGGAACAVLLASCADGDELSAADEQGTEEESTEEEHAEFFSSNQVTLITREAGGGFDVEARIVANYLGEELGTDVIVENQTGAGGLVMMNNTMSATPDGLTIGYPSGGAVTAALAGAPGARYSLEDIDWLGRVDGAEILLVTGSDSEFETWEDVLAADNVRLATEGPGSTGHTTAMLLMDVLGVDGEVIPGFDGPTDAVLSLVRNETDVYSGSVLARGNDVDSGELRALAMLSEERNERFPDAPTALEFDLSAEDEDAVLAHAALQEVFRPLVVPAGVPDGRLQYLRDAVERALDDPGLAEEFERANRDLAPMSGADLAELVEANLTTIPDDYLQVLQESY